MNNCENCGAPLHGNICEYCGSEVKPDYFTCQSVLNEKFLMKEASPRYELL